MGDRVALHSLLERFDDVQRKDILEVAKGHLNENKLRSKVEDVKDNFWRSAKKEPIWTRQKVVLKDHSIPKKSLPPLERKDVGKGVAVEKRASTIGGKKSASIHHKKAKNGDSRLSSSSSHTRTGNEDIYYPETLIPNATQKTPFSKQFIPNHLLFPTKTEQYEQFKKSSTQLMTTNVDNPDDQDRIILQIEKNMRQQLKILESRQDYSVPNFFKFKVFSDAWEQLNVALVDGSNELKCIKADYDSYVNALLEEQLSLDQSHSLDNYQTLLKSDDDVNLVSAQENELRELEDELLNELKKNKKLRRKVRHMEDNEHMILPMETKIIPLNEENDAQNDEKLSQEDCHFDNMPLKDLETEVITLHAQIEEQYHEIEKIKKTQREEYVPRAVFQRLEQSIKEIEVETQKLLKQNDFLEQDIRELEEGLENVLVKTGCKESGKLLWNRINKVDVKSALKL